MTRYETFFFLQAGLKASEVAKILDMPECTAYRWQKNYRKARKRAAEIIRTTKRLSLNERKRLNNLDV